MLVVVEDVWIEVVNIPISASKYLLSQIRILAIRGTLNFPVCTGFNS